MTLPPLRVIKDKKVVATSRTWNDLKTALFCFKAQSTDSVIALKGDSHLNFHQDLNKKNCFYSTFLGKKGDKS